MIMVISIFHMTSILVTLKAHHVLKVLFKVILQPLQVLGMP